MKPTPRKRSYFLRNCAEKKALYPNAIFLALDEAALLSTPTTTRMWAEIGKQPVIAMNFGKKERKTLLGAVNLKNGKLIGQIAATGNTATFKTFLDAIRERYPRGKIIIILDNIRFHHAKKIKRYLERFKRIDFIFLPPYFPKLNPQEMVWVIMRRRVTHNTYYATFRKEVLAAGRFFKNTIVEIKNSPTSLIIRN